MVRAGTPPPLRGPSDRPATPDSWSRQGKATHYSLDGWWRILPPAILAHLYVVTCSVRDALQAHLKDHQIQSLIHYPIPVHHQRPCRDMPRDPEGLGSSEHHANTCLSLPCHPQMDDGQVEAVINAVNSFNG